MGQVKAEQPVQPGAGLLRRRAVQRGRRVHVEVSTRVQPEPAERPLEPGSEVAAGERERGDVFVSGVHVRAAGEQREHAGGVVWRQFADWDPQRRAGR